jgi:hypothetical protein
MWTVLAALLATVSLWDIPLALGIRLLGGREQGANIYLVKAGVLALVLVWVFVLRVRNKIGFLQLLILIVTLLLLMAVFVSGWKHVRMFGPGSVVMLGGDEGRFPAEAQRRQNGVPFA